MAKENKEAKGLKRMRKQQGGDKPGYSCDNCKCKRYSECGCQKKKTK